MRRAIFEPQLTRAYTLATASSTRGYAAVGLAMTCIQLARPDDARMWLARAREEQAPERLLAKAVAMIEPLRR